MVLKNITVLCSGSDMSDVRECQTKSEVKMENSYKVDPGPQGLLPRYGFLSMFL